VKKLADITDWHELIDEVVCGDCLEGMKLIPDKSIDLVLTDPPYPDYHAELYGYRPEPIKFLDNFKCPQFIFWSAKEPFILDYTAIHIWDKKCGVGSMYERIFERNGGANYSVFRYYLINSTVAANYTHETFTGHPSQKPTELLREIIIKNSKEGDLILDPFMGSWTTARACKDLNRRFIGFELSEDYCRIGEERLKQQNLF
jgi:DNA modification methylase